MIRKILKNILPSALLKTFSDFRNQADKRKSLEEEAGTEEFQLRRKFYSQFLSSGDTFFDIGANYGNRIGPIMSLGVKNVIAVEPQPGCCAYLKNHYDGITVLQKGVGAKVGEAELFISNDSVLSSFSKDFIKKTGETRFTENTWTDTQMTEITTLDELIKTYGVPQFIKVDVEGFETEVFKGLNQKVNVISFEYTIPELADNIPPIIEKLVSIGDCTFNYSIGESMAFAHHSWLTSSEMKALLTDPVFTATGFGDIYAKF